MQVNCKHVFEALYERHLAKPWTEWGVEQHLYEEYMTAAFRNEAGTEDIEAGSAREREVKRLLHNAEQYWRMGFRLMLGRSHNATLPHKRPDGALYWDIYHSGYVATAEQSRVVYLVKH